MPHDTIVVFPDTETFDYTDGCEIMIPNDAGVEFMIEHGDAPVFQEQIEKRVTLREVLDFYNKHHNTSF